MYGLRLQRLKEDWQHRVVQREALFGDALRIFVRFERGEELLENLQARRHVLVALLVLLCGEGLRPEQESNEPRDIKLHHVEELFIHALYLLGELRIGQLVQQLHEELFKRLRILLRVQLRIHLQQGLVVVYHGHGLVDYLLHFIFEHFSHVQK